MQLILENEKEIKDIFSQNPSGMLLSADSIMKRCTTFKSQAQLDLCLEVMVRQGTLVVKHSMYHMTVEAEVLHNRDIAASSTQVNKFMQRYARKPTSPNTADALGRNTAHIQPAPLTVSSLPVPEVIQAVTVEQPRVIPTGDLMRTNGVGAVAMAAWTYRKEPVYLSVKRIKEIIGTTSHLYNPLATLVERGYLDVTGEGKSTQYKWSGNFKYPFEFVKMDDVKYIKVQPPSAVDNARIEKEIADLELQIKTLQDRLVLLRNKSASIAPRMG
jgi:hypothetical protein